MKAENDMMQKLKSTAQYMKRLKMSHNQQPSVTNQGSYRQV